MINAFLLKIDDSGWECKNPNCKHDPKYHFNIIGNNYHLIQGQTALVINLGESQEIYCRECIDSIYQDLKPLLDTRLWAFR